MIKVAIQIRENKSWDTTPFKIHNVKDWEEGIACAYAISKSFEREVRIVEIGVNIPNISIGYICRLNGSYIQAKW